MALERYLAGFTKNVGTWLHECWVYPKYEEVYMKDYASGHEATTQLGGYFLFYNEERPHQAHDYRTPQEVYFEAEKMKTLDLMVA